MKAHHLSRLRKPIAATYREHFHGEIYPIGKGAAAVRSQTEPARHTVVAVHGFLEHHGYFTQTYQAADIELILVTCSNYHVPAAGARVASPVWEKPILEAEATIEYDACILLQALEHLPRTRRLRVHGHSRGGAVILEALRRRPELFLHADIVLEAPVLPQGRLHRMVLAMLSPVGHGLWPWVIRVMNATPTTAYRQTFFGRMTPRKQQLLGRLFTTTRDQFTIVRNIENIMEWMTDTPTSIYGAMRSGSILIPEIDRILDRRAMLDSARHSGNHIRIIETNATSHFVTLDSLEWVPPMELVPEPGLSSRI